jgi:chromosome segregation ATPase
MSYYDEQKSKHGARAVCTDACTEACTEVDRVRAAFILQGDALGEARNATEELQAEVDSLRTDLAAARASASESMKRDEMTIGLLKSNLFDEGANFSALTKEYEELGDTLTVTREERDKAEQANAALEADNWALREALDHSIIHLEACSSKLNSMGIEFTSPRFTDRHRDGPVMKALAAEARQVANAGRKALAPKEGNAT